MGDEQGQAKPPAWQVELHRRPVAASGAGEPKPPDGATPLLISKQWSNLRAMDTPRLGFGLPALLASFSETEEGSRMPSAPQTVRPAPKVIIQCMC